MPYSVTYNMDCMIGMRGFPDLFFELAIVDPPYGIGESQKKRTGFVVKQKNGTRLRVSENIYSKKYWDVVPDREYFTELKRVSKTQIIWGANYFDCLGWPSFKTPRRPQLKQFISDHPYNWLIWDKVNGNNDFNDFELAYFNLQSPVRTRVFTYMWNGMMQAKSISNGNIQQGNKGLNEKRIHPTQKPVALYKWLLLQYATMGDKILDTHVGSGSSRIAAYLMGYDFIGFEIDEEHFRDERKRFIDQTSQLQLFKNV